MIHDAESIAEKQKGFELGSIKQSLNQPRASMYCALDS